ncbi:3-methyl-2-oxobutanoate hydroxymethyltransferase [Lentisphaerota bacterium WC36G]|nr:3-methyl-2-oxobutanoate hydroxymethyltransferase [Lentisphaerae bacterium WC36]
MKKKLTVRNLRNMKNNNEKIAMVTAYDATMAKLAETAGIDIILVGDSAGNAIMGFDSTIPVTMDMMVHHCSMVRRGASNTFIVGDMPFLSCQISLEKAIANAGRLIQEAHCDCIKIEGAEHSELINILVNAGIPVMGHLGLLPQRVKAEGGFFVSGRSEEVVQKLIDDAKKLVKAGVCAIVLECVVDDVAQIVAKNISVPIIGIGSGANCDGQVQVLNDVLGLDADFLPKHAKRYANLATTITNAITSYISEVKEQKFPAEENTFKK